jgi:UDP-N-acetylmuramate--alanine ligase
MKNGINTQDKIVMPELKGLTNVYFIGIGGIGMSALARYFLAKGVHVGGYDKTETQLTKELVKEGVSINYTDDINAIPKNAELIVYTPAIPKEHTGLIYYQQNGYTVVKRSDVLGAITVEGFNICVAGTHGKTTISTMIAHILRDSGFGCNAFLGGISTNYSTNFWSQKETGGEAKEISVVEADEYDRSFLKLSPDIAVISSMDADHLDIYGDETKMQDAFVAFGNKVKENGLLIIKKGLKRTKDINTKNKWNYSLQNDAATVFAKDIQIHEGGYYFNVHLPELIISGLKLNVGGMHNVENMVAAIAVANKLEIDEEKIKNAVASYTGVKRRFEYIITPTVQERGGYILPVFIDDYAHHPEELKALLKSTRSLFPQRKITVIFQPHLFTRTRDFKSEFADSLSLADQVLLLPIYPAREKPIEGVSSEIIFSEINVEKKIIEKEALVDWMKTYVQTINKEFGEVIITAGAGDIDALVAPLKHIIQNAK